MDESATICKRRKLDDFEVDDVSLTIHKVVLRMSDKVVLLSIKLNDTIISASKSFSLASFHH